jgi:NADPH:quinone reductase-like Zn-dependent oxidoreductase
MEMGFAKGSTHPADPFLGIARPAAQLKKRGIPMRAAFIERHGGPEVLKFGEMPDPVAASGEVVVDIVAASVNGADWKVREGKSNRLARFPYILGRDFSGVVSVVGEGVLDLRASGCSRDRDRKCCEP